MRQVVSIASALGVALPLGSQAVAQQPPPNPPSGGTPEAMPFDIPYGSAITTDKAKQICQQQLNAHSRFVKSAAAARAQ
jgi:glc operon protein GlcG